MNVTIQGLKSLEIKLDNLAEIPVRNALTKSTLLVEGRAKENCPVDTGQLKNSITSEVEGNTGYVGTNVEYAP